MLNTKLYLARIKRADIQDEISQRLTKVSHVVSFNAGVQGRHDGHVERITFASGKRECVKVGNVARTHRVIAGTERMERVNEQMVYSVQRFSRKQRRGH